VIATSPPGIAAGRETDAKNYRIAMKSLFMDTKQGADFIAYVATASVMRRDGVTRKTSTKTGFYERIGHFRCVARRRCSRLQPTRRQKNDPIANDIKPRNAHPLRYVICRTLCRGHGV
jgi:hypothetical protein